MGEAIAWIIAIGLMVYGGYVVFRDGREHGIAYIVAELILVVLLCAFG